MAALRARHSGRCALSRARATDGKRQPGVETQPGAAGCTCTPTYVARFVNSEGRKEAKALGKNLKDARRAYQKLSVQLDEGRLSPDRQEAFPRLRRRVARRT